MVTQAENEALTRVNAGTSMGELLRRYWQPAALSEELPDGGPPLPITLMGEELVLFRDDQNHPGLIGLHCSHRGADLSYGRLEDGGLRCIYHGWLYDRNGRCLEQPGEPAGSTFNEKILHQAYPCQEVGGLILAYLGPGEPPLLPAYEFLNAPDSHRFATKAFHDCNFLQSNEGNIDQAHVSFLHRFFGRTDDGGQGPRPDSDLESRYIAEDTSPALEPVETDYGLRIYNIRKAAPGRQYVKISNFILPNFAAVPGGGRGDGYTVNWHVPIDDTHHWKYVVTFRRNVALDAEQIHRNGSELTNGYRLVRSQANRYLQDREEMKTKTFLGLGYGFQAHDALATEGAGPIQDRTQEHLGYTDRVIVAARKLLQRAMKDVEEGRDPPHVIRDPAANEPPEIVVRTDVIPTDVPWLNYWRNEALSHQPSAISGQPLTTVNVGLGA